MAGPPTARPRPGIVTVPTPSPARYTRRPGWCGSKRKSTVRRAPSVQSGSSPANFTTTACARQFVAAAILHRKGRPAAIGQQAFNLGGYLALSQPDGRRACRCG